MICVKNIMKTINRLGDNQYPLLVGTVGLAGLAIIFTGNTIIYNVDRISHQEKYAQRQLKATESFYEGMDATIHRLDSTIAGRKLPEDSIIIRTQKQQAFRQIDSLVNIYNKKTLANESMYGFLYKDN